MIFDIIDWFGIDVVIAFAIGVVATIFCLWVGEVIDDTLSSWWSASTSHWPEDIERSAATRIGTPLLIVRGASANILIRRNDAIETIDLHAALINRFGTADVPTIELVDGSSERGRVPLVASLGEIRAFVCAGDGEEAASTLCKEHLSAAKVA